MVEQRRLRDLFPVDNPVAPFLSLAKAAVLPDGRVAVADSPWGSRTIAVGTARPGGPAPVLTPWPLAGEIVSCSGLGPSHVSVSLSVPAPPAGSLGPVESLLCLVSIRGAVGVYPGSHAPPVWVSNETVLVESPAGAVEWPIGEVVAALGSGTPFRGPSLDQVGMLDRERGVARLYSRALGGSWREVARVATPDAVFLQWPEERILVVSTWRRWPFAHPYCVFTIVDVRTGETRSLTDVPRAGPLFSAVAV